MDKDFLMEQYRSLRVEIMDNIKEARKREVFLVTASSLFWAWLLTYQKDLPFPASLCLSFIPIILTALIAMNIYWIKAKNNSIGIFIRQLEKHFLEPNEEEKNSKISNLGWEHFWNRGPERTKVKDVFLVVFRTKLYILIILINLILSALYLTVF